jgi:hypothetical protein
MSDTETPVVEAAPVVDAAPVTDAPAVETAPEVDPFDSGADSFPRDYVEKIRHEAAEYRTKYAPYRDTFEGASPEQQTYLLDVNRLILTDPAAAAAELRELASILGGTPDEIQEAVEQFASDEPVVADDDKPLTLAEWKAIQAQEAAKAEREAGVQAIIAEANSLGYAHGDADEYGDTAALLYIASHKTGGDLAKAHELRSQRFAEAVQAEVDKQIEEIRSGARKWAPVSQGGAAAPAEAADSPKTFADARKRARARQDRWGQVGQ